ncbi:alpha/beta fold hydrolase [Zhihengliuella halotolerans]|uniref:Pimeloyl-ACP methyl ester carboxylesterase n=1 Tax=Zhihengliuella halotolerans TaxID=370736 RepID=A0A4Q8ACI3_9MICC|nr:alpha/beta hydrolase [Zhihengliuella halotolerans]RZU61345.1 pimeloyl-ACP methyl ester carboxylesterase [Zhihengliuella halotolerans]
MTSRRALISTHAVHGATVRCWTYPGQSMAGRTPPVIVAVHGFRGDHHGLARVIDGLEHFTVVVPDLPGFGASSDLPESSGHRHDIGGYAAALQELLVQLEVPADARLLGHSFGSIVAAAHAATHPERWSRVILINPISEPALEGSEALLSRLAHLFYLLGAALPTRPGEALLRWRLVTDIMSLTMTKSRDRATREYVRRQHRLYFGGFGSRRALLQAFEASITSTVRDYAAAVPLTTLLIAGVEDELGSPASQQHLATLFPDARLAMLDDVGHLVHYEAAGSAAALVAEFAAR